MNTSNSLPPYSLFSKLLFNSSKFIYTYRLSFSLYARASFIHSLQQKMINWEIQQKQLAHDDDGHLIFDYEQLNDEEKKCLSKSNFQKVQKSLSKIKTFLKQFKFEKEINMDLIDEYSKDYNGKNNYNLKFISENLESLFVVCKKLSIYFQESTRSLSRIYNDNMTKVSQIILQWLTKKLDSKLIDDTLKCQIFNLIKYNVKVNSLLNNIRGNDYKNLMQKSKDVIYLILDQNHIEFPQQEQLKDLDSIKSFSIGLIRNLEEEYQVKLKSEFQFDVTEVITFNHYQMIKQHVFSEIQTQLFNFWDLNKVKFNSLQEQIKILVKNNFFQNKFLIEQDFIKLNLINLILSIQWEHLNQRFVGPIVDLLNELKYQDLKDNLINEIVEQLKKKKVLNVYKFRKQMQINQSQNWWLQNINEERNQIIIIELFKLLNGIKFIQNNIYFSSYNTIKKQILIQIVRTLNNGNFGYLNMQLSKNQLKKCNPSNSGIDFWRFRVQFSETNQSSISSIKLTNCLDQQLIGNRRKDLLAIEFEKQEKYLIYTYSGRILISLRLEEFEDFPDAYQNIKFYSKNSYLDILRSNDTEAAQMLINRQITQLSIQQLNGIIKPSKFKLQKISDQNVSRNITLCISGFTSEDEDAKFQWQKMFREFGNEFYGIEWKCGTMNEVKSHLAEHATNTLAAIGTGSVRVMLFSFAALAGLASIAKAFNTNPFNDAFQEAGIVGRYLGQLIGQTRIFGQCSVNLIGFSLGTQVILSALEELDTICKNKKEVRKFAPLYFQTFINQVVLLGGVADIESLSKLSLSGVGGKLTNVYSNEDMVLKYLLKLGKFSLNPCGLSPIYGDQIRNFDLSDIIKGHARYREKLEEIMIKIDYDNDLQVFYEN